MTADIWVLGATGRSGRGIAERLHERGHSLVLSGRDPARLRPLADRLSGAGIASGDLDSVLRQMNDAAPAVVVNTVGPFGRTTGTVIDACPAGTHYVDIANELPPVMHALARHAEAADRGTTIVVGAGFGVLATESLVVQVSAERPDASRVRVDAIPSLAVEDGVIGAALAGSILDGLPEGGRKVVRGRLVRAAVAGERQLLTTPDGDAVTTAALPSGELVAAWRGSHAATVVAASNMIPSGPAVRAVLPVVSLLARSGAVRRFAIGRLARVRMSAADMPRRSSWAHCVMDWPDGNRREGWLRLPDAQEFTTAAAAEVAHRLAAHTGKPGAYTPAALFGPSLAVDLGGTYLL